MNDKKEGHTMGKRTKLLCCLLAACLTLGACSRPAENAAETHATAVPEATYTPSPTATPGPTATPSPTATPEEETQAQPETVQTPAPAIAPEKNDMYELLRKVFDNYHAGVAGSTLTAAYYAASIVDWAQTNGLDAARAGALAWDLGPETEFGELFTDKMAALRTVAMDMDEGLLNDCGYTGAWGYTGEEVQAVFDCLDAALAVAMGGEAAPATDEAEELLANMTLEEKVGQLFVVRPDALDPTQPLAQIGDSNAPGVLAVNGDMEDMLSRYPVGGVTVFGKNIQSPEQLKELINGFRQAAGTPLFFAVDEEGGPVARLANHKAFDLPKYENAAAVGSTGDPAQAEAMGSTIGGYLKEYGFSIDFAPVADVNTNPDNPVIGRRAFSSDPRTAAEMAGAMARGLAGQGVLPVYKHFPGHGDTAEDSHVGLAVSYRTLEEMMGCEWLPYINNDLADCAVMVGHIAAPNVTGDMTPASLSYTMVTVYLRQTLGFQGLVITDALAMDGITQTYDSAQAAVMAFEAGCDILLMPYDLASAYDAILNAVESGRITVQRLDESVLRILDYKLQTGVIG